MKKRFKFLTDWTVVIFIAKQSIIKYTFNIYKAYFNFTHVCNNVYIIYMYIWVLMEKGAHRAKVLKAQEGHNATVFRNGASNQLTH